MKINPRLFEHYDIDIEKNLKIGMRCSRPFDTILIDKQGSCYACECQSWLPQSIGNLQIRSLKEIMGSGLRRHLQDSVSDGTYRYCNEQQCTYLQTRDLPESSHNRIKYIRLAIDDSCNLRCPSCRNKMIFHKTGTKFNLGVRLANNINEWVADYPHPLTIHIGSDGDPFASHVYRHFMQTVPRKPTLRYSLLTNGLMFEEFHSKIPHVIHNLDKLSISIDGASKDTYEQLRLGGKWEKINANLQAMAELKTRHKFSFRLHMVVQQDNWWEMEQMIGLAEKYQVDQVYFNKIQDWNTALDHTKQTFTQIDQFKKMLHRVHHRPEKFDKEPKYLVKGFGDLC